MVASTNPPKYWQRQRIRELWPDTPISRIAKAAKVGRDTIAHWRDAGYLDPLPERLMKQGVGGGPKTPPKPKVAKLTAAPLTPEPLCDCQPCESCQYEDVCRERVAVGLWCACETPTPEMVAGVGAMA